MTKYPDLFAALAAEFHPSEVKARTQAGRNFHYVTARAVMNRLDSVLGPESWWDTYVPNANSVLCHLTIRLPDGQTLTKCDAGGYAGMADSGDDDKSGYSDAFKRAAVKFGISRYLYRDGVPEYAQGLVPEPAPKLDARVEFQPRRPEPNGHAETRPQQQHQNGQNQNAPRNGRALFGWTKDMEQRHEFGLLKYLNDYAKLQGFPGRMVDFDESQVALAHAEALRKLQSLALQSDSHGGEL